MLFFVIWIGLGVVTALAANARGRSFAAWLIIGCLTGIFGLIAVLVMKDQSAVASTSRSHADDNVIR